LLVSLLAAQGPLSARPAEIILLRHAEKPADEKNPNLSARGEERAKALPSLVTNLPVLAGNGLPSAVFAARPTTHSHSRRAEETVAPLAKALRLPVETPFSAPDAARLARDVLADHAFDGKTVVICWVHDYLPQLARALGVKHPPDWGGHTFDRVWVITYEGDRAVMQNLPQQLLAGDSSK
jgi:hypothetical protein